MNVEACPRIFAVTANRHEEPIAGNAHRADCNRTLSWNSAGCHAALQRKAVGAQDFAGRFAIQALANRDRDLEESNAQSGGTALHRVRARGRKATGKRSIKVGR